MRKRPWRHLVLTLAMIGFLVTGIFVGMALANQPHMAAALNDLYSARDELQVAEHDKGGHRERALQLVNQAIDQVEMGIAAGR
ncbi:MAG TPA: hypothetical protein VNO81_12235 [Candidatus Nitrosotenuis sp.]|jgi:hypothetical protein|nr:hypothetical protein [Candidatus Nitrosotenuis sp.]